MLKRDFKVLNAMAICILLMHTWGEESSISTALQLKFYTIILLFVLMTLCWHIHQNLCCHWESE